MERIKLFCLPYAGGSSDFYRKWTKILDENISLYPLELRGRGGRYKLPFCNSMEEAVDDIFEIVRNDAGIGIGRYAIFGHSMGSILAYELSRKLIDSGYGEAVHIFFSGRYPPDIIKDTRMRHLMTDNEIIEEMMAIGGISEKLLKHTGLLKIFIRTLRADFKMVETYRNVHSHEKYHFDISVLRGKEDTIFIGEDIAAWKEYTDKTCMFYEFDGGHFFLHNKMEDIAGIINHTLNRCQMSPVRMEGQYGQ